MIKYNIIIKRNGLDFYIDDLFINIDYIYDSFLI